MYITDVPEEFKRYLVENQVLPQCDHMFWASLTRKDQIVNVVRLAQEEAKKHNLGFNIVCSHEFEYYGMEDFICVKNPNHVEVELPTEIIHNDKILFNAVIPIVIRPDSYWTSLEVDEGRVGMSIFRSALWDGLKQKRVYIRERIQDAWVDEGYYRGQLDLYNLATTFFVDEQVYSNSPRMHVTLEVGAQDGNVLELAQWQDQILVKDVSD